MFAHSTVAASLSRLIQRSRSTLQTLHLWNAVSLWTVSGSSLTTLFSKGGSVFSTSTLKGLPLGRQEKQRLHRLIAFGLLGVAVSFLVACLAGQGIHFLVGAAANSAVGFYFLRRSPLLEDPPGSRGTRELMSEQNKRFTRVFCLLMCLVLASGCTIPVFQHPLVDPAKAKACTELHGDYRYVNDDVVQDVRVRPAGEGYPDGFIEIEMESHPSSEGPVINKQRSVGFIERMEPFLLLHVPGSMMPSRDMKTRELPKWDRNADGGYVILRLSMNEGRIVMSDMNVDFIAEQIEAGNLSGQVKREVDASGKIDSTRIQSVMVTAKENKLREFFAKHVGGELFHPPSWTFAPTQ